MSETAPLSDPPAERKTKTRNWPLRLLIALICCLVLLVGLKRLLFQSVPLRISPETTAITEPLSSDGRRVDYFRALEMRLYPPEMQTDENGARILTRALGVSDDKPNLPGFDQQFYEKLGLDPENVPTLKYQQPSDYLKARLLTHPEEFEALEKERLEIVGLQKNAEETVNENQEESDDLEADREALALFAEKKLHEPWSVETLPMMQGWLDENSPALDLLAEAVRKPVFQYPLIRLDENARYALLSLISPGAFEIRGLARGLAARANERLEKSEIDGALEDIISCYRLGRRIGHQGAIVACLVGIAVEGIAHSIDLDVPGRSRIDAEKLRHLLEEWQRLPQRVAVETMLEDERYCTLDSVQSLMYRRPSRAKPAEIVALFQRGVQYSFLPFYFVANAGFDWNYVFKSLNQACDQVAADTYVKPTPSILSLRLLTVVGRSEILSEIIQRLMLPATGAAREAFRRTECGDNLKRIAIAMLLYEREHGTLPPALTVDPDGKPLHGWRVLLLPYLGEEELAAKLRLDEPWDSEHNRQFHETTPAVYQCPSSARAAKADGGTHYSVILGEETMFGTDGQGRRLDEFGPWTMMVVERKTPVCWMRPDAEITQEEAEKGIDCSPDGIGAPHTRCHNVAYRTGRVEQLEQSTLSERFTELIRGTAEEMEP